MKAPVKKLLLVIPIRLEEDLIPVMESEGWYNVRDFYKKTGTSYETHWSGNYVVDQDEIPWKASKEEWDSLEKSKGRVVVISGADYNISDKITLYTDTDGSVYVSEDDLEGLFN
ncbi:MAG: hypothetical protein NTW27_06230 [Deltaproteobacteria bacterium]|jgi:hypothetical protein|nr:hypothetical protein [Deltaproteobacteria bacterium]